MTARDWSLASPRRHLSFVLLLYMQQQAGLLLASLNEACHLGKRDARYTPPPLAIKKRKKSFTTIVNLSARAPTAHLPARFLFGSLVDSHQHPCYAHASGDHDAEAKAAARTHYTSIKREERDLKTRTPAQIISGSF